MSSGHPTNAAVPESGEPHGAANGQIGPLAIGDVVNGRYEVERLLGVGGMGAVYQALHRGIGRSVALKVLNAGRNADSNVLRRFTIEARAAGRARHRHIVEVFDFGVDGALHWMVQELLEGESLEAFITREAPVPPARAVALVDPLLRALAHVHDMGIVHRDLKPGNIFLARENGVEDVVPKLLDFGIALHDDGNARVTSTESIIGTPAYMSPEQIESSKHVTAATDQYAMGCVIYELLCGALPHEATSMHMLLVKKVSEAPVALDRRGLALPHELSECVMRALDRAPERRFADVNAFRLALLEAVRGDANPASHPRASSPSLPITEARATAAPTAAPTLEARSLPEAAPAVTAPTLFARERVMFLVGITVGFVLIVGVWAALRDAGARPSALPQSNGPSDEARALQPATPAPPVEPPATPLPSTRTAPAVAPPVPAPTPERAAAPTVATEAPNAVAAPHSRRRRPTRGRLNVDPENPL